MKRQEQLLHELPRSLYLVLAAAVETAVAAAVAAAQPTSLLTHRAAAGTAPAPAPASAHSPGRGDYASRRQHRQRRRIGCSPSPRTGRRTDWTLHHLPRHRRLQHRRCCCCLAGASPSGRCPWWYGAPCRSQRNGHVHRHQLHQQQQRQRFLYYLHGLQCCPKFSHSVISGECCCCFVRCC
jgi:hypothetical protein